LQYTSGNNENSEIWAGAVGSSASASITVNINCASGANIYDAVADVCEWSGLETSGFLDQTATNSGHSTSGNTGTTATTLYANELWVGSVYAGGITSSTTQSSPTNSFTLKDGASSSSSGWYGSLAYLYHAASATGATNSGTTIANSAYWTGCIATFKSGAPSPPTYSGLSTSTTVSGTSCTFSATFSDGVALQPDGQYTFGTNNTGSWVWQPWSNFTSTPQTETYAITLTSVVGYHVSYMWNFTDNADTGGKQTTGIRTITTTSPQPPTYSSLSVSSTIKGSSCTFGATFNDGVALQPNGQWTFGTNNTGSWVWQSWTNFTSTPQTETVTKTLNSVVGVKISYEWNFTDNAHTGGNQATGVQTFTTTSASNMALTVVGSNIENSAGQVVQIRDVGLEGFMPDLMFWTSTGSDAWADMWQPANTAAVNQTFQVLSTVFHVNCVRFFMFPEWWFQGSVTPSVESGGGYSSTPENVSSYLITLAGIAEYYGIYLDVCPVGLCASSSAFSGDPYADSSSSSEVPMCNDWGSTCQSFLNSEIGQTFGGISITNEQTFWQAFWTSMANTFKSYPNVIFEAWNEPNIVGSYALPAGYLNYLETMYSAIRGTGATNLIFMMWWDGWFPQGWSQNMAWAGQIYNGIGSPTNLAFNNHIYYYAPADLTAYFDQGGVDLASNPNAHPLTVAQLEQCLNALIHGGTDAFGNTYQGMGCTAPLVMNEQGDCRYYSTNVTADYVWWNNLLQAEDALGIGEGAYYWLSDSGLGPAFGPDLTLLSSGYTPNTMGQEFINAYTVTATTLITVPPSATAGTIFSSVVVTAYYSNSSIDTAYTGSVFFTSSDSQAVLPYRARAY
jgi:hypothetical protein